MELIIIAFKAKTVRGIKRLFESIGKPPKNQSAYFDNFKFEEGHQYWKNTITTRMAY